MGFEVLFFHCSYFFLVFFRLRFVALRKARFSASVYFARPLPDLIALRFRAVPAAYSEAESFLMAASGRYRSPVSEDFFPLLVRHF